MSKVYCGVLNDANHKDYGVINCIAQIKASGGKLNVVVWSVSSRFGHSLAFSGFVYDILPHLPFHYERAAKYFGDRGVQAIPQIVQAAVVATRELDVEIYAINLDDRVLPELKRLLVTSRTLVRFYLGFNPKITPAGYDTLKKAAIIPTSLVTLELMDPTKFINEAINVQGLRRNYAFASGSHPRNAHSALYCFFQNDANRDVSRLILSYLQ